MVKATLYAWRDGKDSHSAQVVGEALAHIEGRDGTLTPDAVVASAESAKSPLHQYFDWNDSEAAKKYRLHQARQLISSVRVTIIDETPLKTPLQAFVHFADTREQNYQNLASVLSDDAKRRRLLEQGVRDLNAWRRRYQELSEFAQVFVEVDRALEKVA